jgi:CheY-like chemotaxis protein
MDSQPPQSATEPSEQVPPGTTILVVDDHKPVCDTLKHVLERSGYRVITADSGPFAIAVSSTEHIDGALIDVQMQGMNGFECLRRIQEHRGPIRAWFMAGAPSKEITHAVATSGALGLLPKPFNLPSLLATLREGLAAPLPSPSPSESSTGIREH